jgi:hypothetical protein
MKARRNGFTPLAVVPTLAAAALIVLALVAVIGSAQAAPSTKFYDATVRVVAGPTTTLQLKLTNAAASKQTLGSANFTAPTGITNITVAAGSIAGDGAFTVTSAGNVVKFRSTVPLSRTQSVSANVQVSTTASCGDATWTAEAKQSNDFSGTGNNFSQGTLTNLRPLGSLAIANIGTEVDDPATPVVETAFVPQIKVSVQEDLAVTAKDICNAPYSNYGQSSTFGASATLARKVAIPPRLVHATLTQPEWTSGAGLLAGTGTAALTPTLADVETGDHLVLSDQFTTIKAESNEFDVVEKICTSFDATSGCHWDNGNNNIHVDAAAPPAGASLGIGFVGDQDFSCGGGTAALGSTLIYINPRDYPPTDTTPRSVALTFDKTIKGTSGNTSTFVVCISKTNGEAGSWLGPIPDCSATAPPPCVQGRGRVQGNLVITLLIDPHGDPVGGIPKF